MKLETLIQNISNRPKFKDTVKIDRCPLIHNGFEGNFNSSLGEFPLLKEHGKYLNFNHENSFSVTQLCARNEDYYSTDKNNAGINYAPQKYLALFSMSDICGELSSPNRNLTNPMHYFQIQQTIKMLNELGISSKRIFPSIFGGAKVNQIKRSRANFEIKYPQIETYIPKDEFSEKALLESGIPSKNIQYDITRNTFLSLCFNFQQIGWGYRIEYDILDIDNNLIDIATNEYFNWIPKFSREIPDIIPIHSIDRINSSEIIGIEPLNETLVVNGVGIERLCKIVNKLEDIRKLDEFKKLYEIFPSNTKAVEYIRLLQVVSGDIVGHSEIELSRKDPLKLSKNRNNLINKLVKELKPYNLNLIEKTMINYAKEYNWIPELSLGIDYAINKIKIINDKIKLILICLDSQHF